MPGANRGYMKCILRTSDVNTKTLEQGIEFKKEAEHAYVCTMQKRRSEGKGLKERKA